MADPDGAGSGGDLLAKARALARRHPRLFHMTEAGNGEAIRARGLWSTSALLDRNGVTGEARAAIEASRRAAGVRLPDGAVIRDNGVLREGLLAPLLPSGMVPRDWYRLLNAHVFFWPTDRGLAASSAPAPTARPSTTCSSSTRCRCCWLRRSRCG